MLAADEANERKRSERFSGFRNYDVKRRATTSLSNYEKHILKLRKEDFFVSSFLT